MCVYDGYTSVWNPYRGTPYIGLWMIYSDDGGRTWGGPSLMTPSVNGDIYDASLQADPNRGVVWILYSRNAPGPSNDTIISSAPWSNIWQWSAPTCVVCDGHNNWDVNLLLLNNGTLLAFIAYEGLDGVDPGQIKLARSADGYSWSAPSVIYWGPGEQARPGAIQQPDGSIQVMFNDTQGPPLSGSPQAIARMTSYDTGYSWGSYTTFYPVNYSTWPHFTFVGKQGPDNITVLAHLWLGSAYAVHLWQTFDNGGSWQGPYLVSDTLGTNEGAFNVGPCGPIFTYTGSSGGLYAKRYNWYCWRRAALRSAAIAAQSERVRFFVHDPLVFDKHPDRYVELLKAERHYETALRDGGLVLGTLPAGDGPASVAYPFERLAEFTPEDVLLAAREIDLTLARTPAVDETPGAASEPIRPVRPITA
jgi:hypothetical protein